MLLKISMLIYYDLLHDLPEKKNNLSYPKNVILEIGVIALSHRNIL